jgi:predicted Zn-ribbon and HTH transcriptional regulator
MVFSPASGKLKCEFCGTERAIVSDQLEVKEYNFKEALATLSHESDQIIDKTVVCKKCGSSFTLTPFSISSNCPYCGTPAITDFVREIVPESLIPFQIGEKEAKERFKRWIGSLWFAPTAFTKYFRGNDKLKGYYLPYWTYDSDTATRYQGLRGDTYYVTVTRTVIRNGREEQMRVQEPRVRWTPANGTVMLSFDDVTVGANKTLSRAILDSVGPWNTQSLKPFSEEYLSGFLAEEYTIGLDNGFEYAKVKMNHHIENAIRRDIGGDQQQIHAIDTQYRHTTYKSVLFPLWTASFKWKGRIYNYAINAQSGKISGERPYSVIKILIAVILAVAIVMAALYYDRYYE